MGNLNEQLGSNGQSITCTITALTNGSARQSTAIDNTSNLFMDALVSAKVKTASSSTSATGHVDVYVYATVDNGTTYTDGATGSDGAMTPTSPTNLFLIGSINTVANSTTYYGGPWSVATAFGGVLPAKWGIVVVNNSGGTLDATVGAAEYQGIYGEY
jgi:hypothetical protein